MKIEKDIVRNYLKYETSKCIYGFQKFQTIRSFGDSIYNGNSTISETDQKQNSLLNTICDIN